MSHPTRIYPSVPRTDFGPAPAGYIPGIGRGAVGFTTRSDIGPAGPMNEDMQVRGKVLPGPPGFNARPPPTVQQTNTEEEKKKKEDAEVAKYSDANYDEFSGYNEQLFAGGEYDAEDREADAIYDAIDRRMDSRRKRRREELAREEAEKEARKRPIEQQFADLKRDLATLTEEEWDAIPEALDYSRQNHLLKQQQNATREKFTPLPDHLVSSGASTLGLNVAQTQANNNNATTNSSSVSTALAGTSSIAPDLTSIGRARDKMLEMKLDRVSDSVAGQTVVDPKGYLTDLNSIKVSSDAEVSDIKKARLLLRSVIQTNPKHAPGWIAAARLEKETGKMSEARSLILKGCEMCPKSEDVWMEAAAMVIPKEAKAILAQAVLAIPTSVNLWIMAASLETEIEMKKAVYRRALEVLPNSVRLWKAAVELEDAEDARVMLSRAVELVPESTEMWLALAKLESYERARVVLNRARKAIPTDPTIWLTAAKLEEVHGNTENVDVIVQKAVKSLAKFQVILDRDAWLHEAEIAEQSQHPVTCQAIVTHTVGLGVEDLDRQNTWMADADNFTTRGSYGVARAIYNHLLTIFPSKKSIWLKAAHLEKQHGDQGKLDQLLSQAVKYCPQVEILWLMRAKEKWLQGDIDSARHILNDAFTCNKDSEEIWLAATKLEYENNQYERARKFLSSARESADTPRVWMKSAKLERLLKQEENEEAILEKALIKFPNFYKLWLMRAQQLFRTQKYDQAREVYKKAIKACPNAVEVWLNYAYFEVEVGKILTRSNNSSTPTAPSPSVPSFDSFALPTVNMNMFYSKARSILETARQKIPHQPSLWLAAIRIELLAENKKVAEQLLAKGFQDLPTAGLLWAFAVAMDDIPKKKGRAYEGLKKCPEDPYVFLSVAKLCWSVRKLKQAREFFARSVQANGDYGDAWATWYKFELEHGNEAEQTNVIKKCMEADPAHGELWQSVSKKDENVSAKSEDILKMTAAKIKGIFDLHVPL